MATARYTQSYAGWSISIDIRNAVSKRYRAGTNSISAAWRRRAASSASSLRSSSLRTFFQRTFADSAISNSGAINLALCLSARASGVPSSSTTHLSAMLASITKVLTALHVLPEGEFPTGSASGASLAFASQRPTRQRMIQLRQSMLDGGFPDARPRSNGRAEQPGALDEQSDYRLDFVHADFQPSSRLH